MENFNSEWWFTHFKRLAERVYHYAEGNFVIYHNKMFDRVREQYEIRHKLIKADMFGDGAADGDSRLDRHKIAALYIQLFLKYPVFEVQKAHSAPYPKPKTVFINELYCLDIMRSIFRKWTDKSLDIKNFEEYKPRFIELLACYRDHHTKIDKISPHFHFTYALAHIMYFIERDFMEQT